MPASKEKVGIPPRPGLCGDCIHARRVESARGSMFFLCQRSFTDVRFDKYPRLPVLSCLGYEKQPPAGNSTTDRSD